MHGLFGGNLPDVAVTPYPQSGRPVARGSPGTVRRPVPSGTVFVLPSALPCALLLARCYCTLGYRSGAFQTPPSEA